jgi:diphosphate--fructose-6-phosphate 1-phosphotransferase
MGRQAPGGNNVIDGLIRYQSQRHNVGIFGFVNGVDGLLNNEYEVITKDNFKNYVNLGGYDYIGRGADELRTETDQKKAFDTVMQLGLTGLVIVGATNAMTDAIYLVDYFEKNNCGCRIITVPATVDGNVHHNYIQTAIGFDTASKIYSQLIGNMLTDSASAIKYWYFIRLMGKDASHLAVECSLKTSPNYIIVGEECRDRNESIQDIVKNLCNIIEARANEGKNFGCVIIPEGLFKQISSFNNMIVEMNQLFRGIKTPEEASSLQKKLQVDAEIKLLLTPWSYSLFNSLPDFFKQQILTAREIEGSVKLSHIETEKLIAYFVQIELERRKKAGTYKGSFAPVTHFFGYQGRSGHPSAFDCSLGSTCGFAAGVLIERNLTGLTVAVRQVTQPVKKWRIGAVPILAMIHSHPKEGFQRSALVVRSEDVRLDARPFQALRHKMKTWKHEDRYRNPGPIQFYLDEEEVTQIAESVGLVYAKADDLTTEISGLCSSIQNDCLFTEKRHLLMAALSSLKSAKDVINSLA